MRYRASLVTDLQVSIYCSETPPTLFIPDSSGLDSSTTVSVSRSSVLIVSAYVLQSAVPQIDTTTPDLSGDYGVLFTLRLSMSGTPLHRNTASAWSNSPQVSRMHRSALEHAGQSSLIL